MALISVKIDYETHKATVSDGDTLMVADDHDPKGAVLGLTSRLLKKAIEQGALNESCPIQITIKRL